MKYILKRDRTGDWGIWDTRNQRYFCEGLNVEEARERAKEKNEENDEEIRKYIE